MIDPNENFSGYSGRECGEHRTTGGRAWCHGCTEWCYPDSPCKGCELPHLRAASNETDARVEQLENTGRALAETLAAEGIAGTPAHAAYLEFRAVLDGNAEPADLEKPTDA